jgi:hypothetical protein
MVQSRNVLRFAILETPDMQSAAEIHTCQAGRGETLVAQNGKGAIVGLHFRFKIASTKPFQGTNRIDRREQVSQVVEARKIIGTTVLMPAFFGTF